MLNSHTLKTHNEFSYSLRILIIAIALNFLSGISFDLYTPSMPVIVTYYHTTPMLVKNTVTATVVGFAIGCITFGIFFDFCRWKPIILISIIFYTMISLSVLICNNIYALLLIRFFQGFTISSVSIGSRKLIMNNFTGQQLIIGLLYLSTAYSLGPVIAPFIGGFLQWHFSWKINFLVYAIYGLVLTVAITFFVDKNQALYIKFSFRHILASYFLVFKSTVFLLSVTIVGLAQFELMVYPTFGAFIVEDILHYSSLFYGKTALVVGLSYFTGSILNRILLSKHSLKSLVSFGFFLLIFSIIFQINFTILGYLNLFTLLLPICIIGIGLGFIFPNIFGNCLRLFPQSGGVATASFIFSGMLIAAIGILITAKFPINSLKSLLFIFTVTIFIQLCVFFIGLYKKI